MKPEEQEEIQQEVEAELQRRGSINSMQPPPANALAQAGEAEAGEADGLNAGEGGEDAAGGDHEVRVKQRKVKFNEKSLFGKKCYRIFKVRNSQFESHSAVISDFWQYIIQWKTDVYCKY